MAALAARDPLMPRSPDGQAPGALLSLLAHAALVTALAYGVQWRSPAPTPISAELWAAVPQVAAPAAPTAAPVASSRTAPEAKPAPAERTAPPTPDAQIAIDQARREKADQARAAQQEHSRQARLDRDKAVKDKAEADKQRRDQDRANAAAQVRAQAEEDKRLVLQREENLRRMMGQLGGSGEPSSRGTAPVAAAPSAAYAGRLVKAIKDHLKFDWRGPGNPAAVVEVRSAPSGTITGTTLVTSSGVKEWDDAILRAIDAAARLPADSDGRVPPVLTITFRPRD